MAEKKRRGRPPRKQPDSPAISSLGVVERPSNYDESERNPMRVYVLELLYTNPSMFKRIFSLYRNMQAEQVRMRFERDCIKMFANDHCGRNKIYTLIDGGRLTRYFCERPIEVYINTLMVQKVLSTINKDNGIIVWQTTRQYEKSRITIMSNYDEVSERSVDDIDIASPDPYNWEIEEELAYENEYPVHFRLPFKYFKKRVGDFRLLGDTLYIGGDSSSIRFSYQFNTRKGNHISHFMQPEKIELESRLEDGDGFAPAVRLEHIRPVASSLISEHIYISADYTRNLIFTIYLDSDKDAPRRGTCTIKIITDVVRSD